MEAELKCQRIPREHIVTKPNFDTYVCLDLETTSRPRNRIIEIGAVLVVNGRVKKSFKKLVDPGIHIPNEITRLTGITNSMVSGRRSIWQILPELKEFVGDRIIIGHDIIRNDMKILIQTAERCGIEFDNPLFDTLAFSRTLFPGNCGLGEMTELLEVPWETRHRAYHDAYANMEVFEKLKLIYIMSESEGIHLGRKEIARIARHPERYVGVSEKYLYSI